MNIPFGSKFTSKDLTSFVVNYYDKSMTENEVVFSLKKIEWISVEELTFLFGWIRNVKYNNVNLKKLFVELPTVGQSEPESFENSLVKEEIIRRRRTRLISLYENWRITQACDLKANESNLTSDINQYLGKGNLADNNWHSIIPFKAIPFLKYESYKELVENIKSEVKKGLFNCYLTIQLGQYLTTMH
jgi:hypothetical protein